MTTKSSTVGIFDEITKMSTNEISKMLIVDPSHVEIEDIKSAKGIIVIRVRKAYWGRVFPVRVVDLYSNIGIAERET